jgi:hypothetical protein
MDKGDLEAEHAVPRRFVDQLGAGLRKMRQRGANVLDFVSHVMHSGPSLREEPADRRVVAERAQELEPALADPDGRGLDTLLLDARAVLEPGAEVALVRVECAIEILDRKADMVDGAGLLHPAIVCERLAPTMRVSALALALAVVSLAGCGGHGESAEPNGEASKPAARVLADAKAAATKASSAHVSGNIVSSGTPITLDLRMARGKGAKGSMSISGRQFDLVRIGDAAYIHGSDAFWRHYGGAAVAQLLHDRWVKASVNEPRFASLRPLTSIGQLFGQVSAHHGKLANDGKTSYKGRQVVAIRDTSDNSKLYVAATGKPYPMAIVGGGNGQSGTIAFDDWSSGVSLGVPKDAIDISQLGG